MRGLRTQENAKFINFFNAVQKEADSKNAVFFLDCGLGNVVESEIYECESLTGWMIPKSQAEQFEPIFLNNSLQQHNFDEFYCTVDFELIGNHVEVRIETEQE